jgi:hypothetical protein
MSSIWTDPRLISITTQFKFESLITKFLLHFACIHAASIKSPSIVLNLMCWSKPGRNAGKVTYNCKSHLYIYIYI